MKKVTKKDTKKGIVYYRTALEEATKLMAAQDDIIKTRDAEIQTLKNTIQYITVDTQKIILSKNQTITDLVEAGKRRRLELGLEIASLKAKIFQLEHLTIRKITPPYPTPTKAYTQEIRR